MEPLFETQQALQSKIANAITNFKSKRQDKMTRGNVNSRLQGLEDTFKTFQANHKKILTIKDLDKKHPYFTSNMNELVDFIDSLAVAAMSNQIPPPPSPHAPSTLSLTASSFAHSLPKTDLPKFSGQYSEWENFRDVFLSLIQRRDDMIASVKLYFSRTHLTGEALDKIKSLSLSNDKFERAWTALTDYYENKRRLVTSHLSDFFLVKTMKCESAVELKRLIKETFNPLAALDSLDMEAHKFEDIVVFLTASRFDPITRREWERQLGSSGESPHSTTIMRIRIISNSDSGIDRRWFEIQRQSR